MKIVIIDMPNVSLELKNRQLYVNGRGIPLRLMEILVLQEDVVLHSKLILKLSKEGIAIMHVAKNSMDMALTLPLFSKNSEVKMFQYASLENRLGLAKYFVEEKIAKHVAHLKSTGVVVDANLWKDKVSHAKNIETLLGVEGSFSKLYFQYFFRFFPPMLHKGKRSKRPALDPVNAILSYVYTMAYHLLTMKLYMAGFEPSIGYLHTPFRSHNALSSDFMELFRAKINEQVMVWFDDGLLVAKDFTMKNGVWLKYESRKRLWKEMKFLLHTISDEADKEISLIRTAIS